jgi:predicted metal-binding protein
MAKKKIKEFHVGHCNVCNKEHKTTNGGWIINAEHKLFCHGFCFDLYVDNAMINKSEKSTWTNQSIIKPKKVRWLRKVCTITLTNEKKLVLQEVNLNLLYLRSLIRVVIWF